MSGPGRALRPRQRAACAEVGSARVNIVAFNKNQLDSLIGRRIEGSSLRWKRILGEILPRDSDLPATDGVLFEESCYLAELQRGIGG